jgi:xylulokinase
VQRFRLAGFDELEAGARRTLSALGAGRGGDPRPGAPLFLPYLGDGERDDPTLRAAFIGLSDRHGQDELSYAVVEGLAFAIADSVSVLAGAGTSLQELRVAGGGARADTLGQIKADALERPVRHLDHDSAPVGAALLAAGQVGHADEARAALAANVASARCFEPDRAAGAGIRERYQWFQEVRGSAAVRLLP